MAKKKKTSAKSKDDISFEESLCRLEAIVEDLEAGNIDLGDSLKYYEEGIGYLQQCHQLLKRAERRIELLGGVDDEGNPLVEPFDDAETSLAEKEKNRTRRRSTPATGAKRKRANRAVKDDAEDDMDSSGSLF